MGVLMKCGCDVSYNALTMCDNCYHYFLKTGSVVYKDAGDREKITISRGGMVHSFVNKNSKRVNKNQ